MILRKRTPALYTGNCKKCSVTYALFGEEALKITTEARMAKNAA